MVFKKTEYRREFRGPQWNQHFHHYKEKVDYCLQRRHLEYHHEPFQWDDWEWDKDDETEKDIDRRPQSAPVYQQDKSNKDSHTVHHRTSIEDGTRESLPIEDRPIQDSPQIVTKTKPKAARPQTAKDASRKRVRSPKQVPTTHKAPFLPFGWADKQRETGTQRTHNVKAAVSHPFNIYPAALRARKRQEIEMVRQKDALRQENYTKKRQRALFNEPPQDTSSQWLTEYRRNFSAIAPK
ncbi:centriole, cilia and spindle-associated protein-like [Ptychodera flava]|uniref:centriole, cilia and spindle-associated protein-like n=1 Tax=Ptychodera flava TaxID=63121 RepID=UPI00396A0371